MRCAFCFFGLSKVAIQPICRMPAWWNRKCGKNKEQRQLKEEDEEEGHQHAHGHGHGVLQFNFMKSPIRNRNRAKKRKDKPKSFDELSSIFSLSRKSPRTSKDFTSSVIVLAAAAAAFSSSCCSDSNKKGLPLPRPSVSSVHSFGNDQGLAFGSASISGSSLALLPPTTIILSP